MLMRAHEGLEALRVGEFDIEHPTVSLDQREGVELALVTLIVERSEVAPINLKAFAGRRFQRQQQLLLRAVQAGGGAIGARQVEMRRRLVQRLQGQCRRVLADGALGIALRQPELAEPLVQFVVQRSDVVQTIERGRGLLQPARLLQQFR